MKNFDFLLDAPTTRDLSTDELLLLPSEEDLDSKFLNFSLILSALHRELRFFTPQIADKYFKMDENTGRMLLSQSALSQSSHDPLLKAALSSSGISAETDMAPSSIVSAPVDNHHQHSLTPYFFRKKSWKHWGRNGSICQRWM